MSVFAQLLLLLAGSDTPPPTARDALTPFNVLVGTWRGSGAPEGTRDERAAGAWSETIEWSWKFKGEDAWLAVSFAKGKHFTKGELRYTPAREANAPARFTLTLTTPDKSTVKFAGTLKDKTLTLTRLNAAAREEERLIFSLLHHNRHLYRLESRPAGSSVAYSRKYQVGATKEGVPFADVPRGPECVVSGGVGTIRIRHDGKDYWVCCTGCRDEFRENPEKYIKEFQAKTKKP